jgi:hypothetical protein
MEQFVFYLRNLPLKRLVADALGEIELTGCSRGSWKRLCNSSRDIRACQVRVEIRQPTEGIMLSPAKHAR